MTSQCTKCQCPLAIGDWPFCPHGPVRNFTVRPDSIPGGMVIENLGPKPQTFYSKSDYKAAMAAAGVRPFVRHVPEQGSDKSKVTQRWV